MTHEITAAEIAKLERAAKKKWSHLANMSPEQHAAFRATIARIGKPSLPAPPVDRDDPNCFAHLVGNDPVSMAQTHAVMGAIRAAETKSFAKRIVAAGAKARGEIATAPKPTGLAARIISAAKRAVRI